ncbi:IQ calmodulin-binding motif family protein, putative [Ichthyophthirius multifiliis]|uniref:IQ calmodulin-binding motif family protein, putative n=1 Tax=Ichthyophthirius multifiliis TaxID=5932 RepID=G0QLQ2_ICHMU|nr:IQ calmodulin-binding motif family protein, putative [Ichthyophthirius multifiliis]EGR33848.1 IQ calmodulin-binding motif family protein, putative [Ichthyophthirius multifiliis]|eukprot:XP_004039072.1 IQ calmodulin-binding motif family protein, putative [Ichthyophthirius multifiliis]
MSQESINQIILLREQALKIRQQSQIKAMNKLLNSNHISPRTYDNQKILLEKWVKHEKDEILKSQKALKRGLAKALQIIIQTQRDLLLAEKCKKNSKFEFKNSFGGKIVEGEVDNNADVNVDVDIDVDFDDDNNEILKQIKEKWKLFEQINSRIEYQLSEENVNQIINIENGFSTNIFTQNQYVDRLFEYIQNNHKHEIIQNLNTFFGFFPQQRLRLIHGYDQLNSEFYQNYANLPFVLNEDIFIDFEYDIIGNEDDSKLQTIQEYQYIHNKVLFDSLNEALNIQRPFYQMGGKPYPWTKTEKIVYKELTNEKTILQGLTKAKQKIKQWSSNLCGLINDNICVPKIQEGLDLNDILERLTPDNDYLSQVIEDRLSQMLLKDIKENEYKWLIFEDEKAEILMEISDLIFEFLVDEFLQQKLF